MHSSFLCSFSLLYICFVRENRISFPSPYVCVCVNECPLRIAVLHHATAATGGTDVVATPGVVQCFSHQIGRVSSTSHSTPSCCLGVHSRPALSDL